MHSFGVLSATLALVGVAGAQSTSGPYTPPVSYTTPPHSSAEYPTYYPTSTSSDYVPPSYTPGPNGTSYAPDTNRPSYTPPNPYTTATSVIIVSPSANTSAPSATPSGNYSYTPIVGPPGVELRLGIEDLEAQYPDMWNMFLIALESMMIVDESKDLSYYQVSGIHGLPHIPWQYPVSSDQDPSTGYCTHGSGLFSTWHRPYMSLIEQVLCDHAVKEADKFTGYDAQKYKDAAKKLRFPYWDWASQKTKSHLPGSVTATTVSVFKPAPGSGEPTQATIPNPLYSYKFLNDEYRNTYFEAGFFRDTDSTRRQPDSTGASHNEEADNELSNSYDSRLQNTFNLFSIPTFQGFSSNSWDGGSEPNAWTSIESIHNDIHVQIGGPGHMSSVEYAAFDPIFWLHHCNVDRLTAMYQAVWPGQYVLPQQASGTFARIVQTGDLDTIDTPLYPFRHRDGKEWTSNDVKDAQSIYKYGYAYPEVPVDYQDRSSDELRTFTTEKVNTLYQPELQGAKPVPSGGNVRTEWVAHLAYDASEIPGDFGPLIFLGEVPHDVKDWKTNPNFVGQCPTFGAADLTKKRVIQGCVPLTKALTDKKIGLSPEEAVPYLRDNCNWVIQQDGYSVPLTSVKSLKVGVSSTEVQYFDDNTQLAKWGQAYTHYDVTAGRQGGLQYNETYLVASEEAPAIVGNNTSGTNSTAVRLKERSRPFRF